MADPFARHHPDHAPGVEPLQRVENEPDGFAIELTYRPSGAGSLVSGTLTVGSDWASWQPPSGPAVPIDLRQIAYVHLEASQWLDSEKLPTDQPGQPPRHVTRQTGQLCFTHLDGTRHTIACAWRLSGLPTPEAMLRWVADSLTARALRARGEPLHTARAVIRELAETRRAGPGSPTRGAIHLIRDDADELTFELLAFPRELHVGCWTVLGLLGALGLLGMGLQHPLVCPTACAVLVPALLVGFAYRRRFRVRLTPTAVTITRYHQITLYWSDIQRVELLEPDPYRDQRLHPAVVRVHRNDGAHVDFAFGTKRVSSSGTEPLLEHVEWLAELLDAHAQQQHQDEVPPALTQMRATEPSP